MAMGGREQEKVMLLPHKMNMRLSRNSSNQEPVELPLYNIVGWELTQRNMDCPEEGIRMVVVLRRKPWREVFTTYLPTILLMMTTYVTTFFKPEFFEAALGANLTTMLMMTTIFMTSLSELTDTAYAKWIDFWLIFSQLVPFIEVILLTLKEAYREEEMDTTKKTRRRRRKRRTSPTPIQSLEINVVQPYEGEVESNAPQAWNPDDMDKNVTQSLKNTWKMPKRKLFYWKFLGNNKFYIKYINSIIKYIFLTERMVLPCVILSFFIVYICVSIFYYMEEHLAPFHICTKKV